MGGKSAWINAFANYCSYKTLRDAEKAGGKFPIYRAFDNIRHPQTGDLITITSECSEFIPSSQAAKVGESDIQCSNKYVFQYNDTKIAIIDTPGLQDTKDLDTGNYDTDKKHVNNILNLLLAYDKMHAICIFLRATETRLSDAFQYTITEIFRHLDKSAINNVIFVFTFAASAHFKPEKTQPILQ